MPVVTSVLAHRLCAYVATPTGLAEPEDLKGQGKVSVFRAPGAEGRVSHSSCNLYRKQGGGLIPQAECGPKRRIPAGLLRSDRGERSWRHSPCKDRQGRKQAF